MTVSGGNQWHEKAVERLHCFSYFIISFHSSG